MTLLSCVDREAGCIGVFVKPARFVAVRFAWPRHFDRQTSEAFVVNIDHFGDSGGLLQLGEVLRFTKIILSDIDLASGLMCVPRTASCTLPNDATVS